MIIRDRPRGLQLLYALRGSILPSISGKLALCAALALAVTFTHGFLFQWKITLTLVPFSLIGLALAIFLGFRNGVAYDRYWEARKLWGELVTRSRSVARQVLTLLVASPTLAPDDATDPRRLMMMRTLAFASALRHQLRESRPDADLNRLLPEDEAAQAVASPRATEFLLRRMAMTLGACVRDGSIHPALAANIDESLSAMAAVAAGCERIKNTPVPFAYTLLLHRTAWLYCVLLPFGLVDTVGLMTPFVVLIVAYTFFGLDALGDQIEEPFGLADNHLPLDALCREIERSVLDTLGVRDLPEPLVAVDSRLS